MITTTSGGRAAWSTNAARRCSPASPTSTTHQATGRFLTRSANPTQRYPYVPLRCDPAGAMLAPLALLAMVYGKKKKHGKWDTLIILLVLSGAVGMSLSSCGPEATKVNVPGVATATITPMPTQPQNYTVTVQATTVKGTETATFTLVPAETSTPCHGDLIDNFIMSRLM